MSVKHVKDYYDHVTKDYMEMREVLKEMENINSEEAGSSINNNIEFIKQNVETLKENYMRISYIIYLLNKPNKKEKQRKYIKEKEKVLNNIPYEDTLLGILGENKESIDNIKDFLK